jgi:tetratricopeptide (TPR) repeat protein
VNNTPKEITDIDGWEQLNFFPKHDHQSKDVSNEKKSQPIIIDNVSEEPLNTVSIAHLYLNQGHLDKAEEVINKILELRPNDAESIRLQKIIDAKKNGELSEDLGRKNLMNIIDEKVLDNRAPDYVILENFLQHIQKKALEKRA